DFIAARRRWQQLLATNPSANENLDLSRSDIAARILLCDIISQHPVGVPEALAKFAEEYPDDEGTLAGRTDRWTILLRDQWEQARRWPPQQTSDDLTTYAGDSTRQHIAPRSIDVGGELWSVALPNPRLPTGQKNVVFPPPLPLAFHPAVVDDLVLINDGRQIHAWNLYSGKPYWDASREDGDVIYPVVADPSPMMPIRPVVGQAQWTVTVANGRVYARMGSAVTTPAATEFRDLPAELVCLDISQGEGQLLWKQTADDLAPAAGELPVWRWEGTPIVEGGRVYAVLSRRRPQLEWSIACLDAESGLMLWQRSIGITRPTPPDHENRASSLLLTSGGGQLYLATGWGALVAVDPRDGTVNWAVTYESNAAINGSLGTVPLLYHDGRLYAVLLDGDRLASLDATTGRFVWSRDLAEPYREILGVAQGRLIVSGRSLYAFDAETKEFLWSVPGSEPDDSGYGRGALAGDQVLWTTKDVLWFIDQRDGRILREHPLQSDRAPRGGGNVVLSHDVLLIAGADRVTAYGQYARLQEQLQQPLSDRRQQLRRDLKLAEIAWSTGKTARAEVLWDQVRRNADSGSTQEQRRASARVSLLPGRRPPRVAGAKPSRIAVTPVGAVTNTRSIEPKIASIHYWRRVTHRPVDDETHARFPATMPGDRPLGVLFDDRTLSLWDITNEREHALAQATDRVEWAGQSAERLLVVTTNEILIFDRDTFQLRSRRPRRESTPATWRIHPHGLLMLAPPHEIALLDVDTGEWRWRRTAESNGWQSQIGWSADRLAVHPRGVGGAEIWDIATGATLRREHPRTAPWKMTPVFTGYGDDYLTVTEDERLQGVSVDTDRRWEYAGVLSQTHTPPWVFLDGDDVVAVIDGTRLVRIARSSGWPRWSTVIADVPLRVPSEQIAVIDKTCFTAAAGVLRATDFHAGKTRWVTPSQTSPSMPMRSWISEDAAVVAAIPYPVSSAENETQTAIDSVTLYSTATGRPVQTLKLPSPTARLDLADITPRRTAILTDRDLIIYEH
ncbi:MAG TPA: PQQ-binding-like beta-propeller repeat protein, partial [Planctomycetaceae bacterium]|nr:PQQ-binding-like beta-propeller repeat protein [Planctomycetaceae bacterium]